MFETKLFIGGEWLTASDGATYERFDPVNNVPATVASAAGKGDANEAANAAARAFPRWSEATPGDRARFLSRAAEILETHAGDFRDAMAAEIGSTDEWAAFNCDIAADMLREAARLTDRLTETPVVAKRHGVQAYLATQPAGVVLGIAPWNAPVVLGIRAIATPLACGNTVVLKGSELCPRVHGLIAVVMEEAGFPPGVVNFVTNAPDGAPNVVETLIAHQAVRRVNFTGSTRVGRIIADMCAKYLKPSLLELSGKAPLLVLDDADLDQAVNAAAFGAYFNQGQICLSTDILVVDRAVADDFLDRLRTKVSALEAGDPREGSFSLGSMISREAAVRVKGLIDDAVAKGATLVIGGGIDETIMQPTILDGVTSAMRIYEEETFGPVVSVIRVDGDEEAVSVANDNEFGLSAAVFSRDIDRARAVSRRIESGMCHINGPTVYDEAQMPIGGMKSSGYGRFGGEAGVREFTELRWISIHNEPPHYPI